MTAVLLVAGAVVVVVVFVVAATVVYLGEPSSTLVQSPRAASVVRGGAEGRPSSPEGFQEPPEAETLELDPIQAQRVREGVEAALAHRAINDLLKRADVEEWDGD